MPLKIIILFAVNNLIIRLDSLVFNFRVCFFFFNFIFEYIECLHSSFIKTTKRFTWRSLISIAISSTLFTTFLTTLITILNGFWSVLLGFLFVKISKYVYICSHYVSFLLRRYQYAYGFVPSLFVVYFRIYLEIMP